MFGTNASSQEPISLSSLSIAKDVIAKVPTTTVQTYTIMPVACKGNVLTIAMIDPFNIQTIDDLKFRLGYDINGVRADEQDIKVAMQKYYGLAIESSPSNIREEFTSAAHEALQSKTAPLKPVGKEVDASSLKDLANQAPVIKLLNLILLQAVKDHASDIHLEPFEDDYKIRYRVDGILYEMSPPPKSLALALTSRIKVMANLDISERRLPQDGRIVIVIENTQIDLRVSTLPTAYGESVVIRVLDKSVVALSLEQVGMRPELLVEMRKLIQKPNGIILVTGPTGSGKTTTLYSALKEINTIDRKLITTEDPVEYDIDGIVQVPINAKINLTFACCLRSILRQDPDIIMVGEIRDEETAQIAVQSALTGHLVFSTLHTNDAPGAVTRLLDMGVEPFLVTSSLQAVLAQRLVRTICTDCKEPYAPSEYQLRELGLTQKDIGNKKFFKGRGCPTCNNTGYKGRTGIFELFSMNDMISALVLDHAPAVTIRQKAQEFGMKTLREYGLMKIFDGSTSPEEVIRETQTYI